MTTPNPTATVATAPATKPAKPAPNAKVTKPAAAAPKAAKKPDLRVVRLLVDHNPKKEGSKAFARFALYKDGQTVTEALAVGILAVDLAWDTRRKHIELLPPA